MADAKTRLKQTFQFLKGLNELRNPIAHDLSGATVVRLDEWESHPCIEVRRGEPEPESSEGEEPADLAPLIRIKRPRLTHCPAPPTVVEGWLRPGWNSIDVTLETLETRNFEDAEGLTTTIAFTDSQERVTALDSWAAVRQHWIEAERPAVRAYAVFERIHALWTLMQREGDRKELVIAEGMLSVPEHHILHPVLAQKLNLHFDPAVPEFQFGTGTEAVELSRALLRAIPNVDAAQIAIFDRELAANPVEPLGDVPTKEFLRRLVQGLFPERGEFLDCKQKLGHGAIGLWREAVLVVRARTAGLSETLDHIIEDLEQQETLPPEGLARIVGIESYTRPEQTIGIDAGANVPSSAIEQDILFSKPSNAEQHEIAARLATSGAVLVQGPPGTGKTHTIANLLGHLLGQGKTVLVTAHTTKALRVLRQQVEPALQPLCMSVLEGDPESQAQLAHAAQAITERLSNSHAPTLRQRAGSLWEKRRRLLALRTKLRNDLRDARYSEIEEIVVNGEAITPIDAARRIKDDVERDGWLPGPLHVALNCPLSEAEVHKLYLSQTTISHGDEQLVAVSQPELGRLVSVGDFRALAHEQVSSRETVDQHRPELWDDTCQCGSQGLQELHRRVVKLAETLSETEPWLREVLFSGWVGGDMAESWRDLLSALHVLATEAAATNRLIVAHGPELASEFEQESLISSLQQIVTYLEGGGSFGLKTKLMHRAWHQLADACKIDGRPPTTLDNFRTLLASARLAQGRDRFVARWKRTMEPHGGPSIAGSAPERLAQVFAESIGTRIEWRRKHWEPAIRELRATGFRWDTWLALHPPVPGETGELERVRRAGTNGLASIIGAMAASRRQDELSASLAEQRTYLSGFPQSEAAFALLKAQDEWDPSIYEQACSELARLDGLRGVFLERIALLQRLEESAPGWAYAIANRTPPHDAGMARGSVADAWRYRQWVQELDRRASVSMPRLQEAIERAESELLRVASEIIEAQTWASQRERTTLPFQQAFFGFVETIRKIGKGTGRRDRVLALLRDARRLLTDARAAVPVWIMPLNRVYESFDPRITKFDVVIIDEASQSDVTALAALYLGKEHVVVGDKEQVTPDAIGQSYGHVQRLIASELGGIPNSHLYDGQTSIYDLAEMSFGGVVALREHFRCVPEIIQFCNDLSYNRSIKPLREPGSSNIYPALVTQRINGARGDGKTNPAEAVEIASLLCACLRDPEYSVNEAGKAASFGVISLLGDEQAILIETLLRHRVSPEAFERHRLLCGNAAQFQGDERDVVFLSMVDGPPAQGQLSFRDAGPKDLYKKRYNVAVSRARNQLWLVHSVDPAAHLQARDIRRRLIEHTRDPLALLRVIEAHGQRTESIFERLVMERLVGAGYRVASQWRVGARRIDLVVVGLNRKLAVECDGERWHTREELQADLARQAVLERLGWTFVRIRGSLFFRDPDAAMAPLWTRIGELGIEALGPLQDSASGPSVESSTVERIRAAAAVLRESWRADDIGSGSTAADEPEQASSTTTGANQPAR